jgi:hypothetical protein
VGSAPDGPAKHFWCLGAIDLRPSRGRHASSGSARLFAAMQDIWVSLHSIRSRSTYFHGFVSNGSGHHNFSYDITDNLFIRHAFQDSAGYPRILAIDDLKPLRGRYAYKASSRSALPDSLQPCWEIWVSLHFVPSRP